MAALCTAEYYNDVYKGADLGDELDALLERASDDVRNVVTAYDLDGALPEAMRECIKKAVCAQAEYAGSNGGIGFYTESTDGGASLGSFSISATAAAGGGANGSGKEYSDRMISFLDRGGLLYRGRI